MRKLTKKEESVIACIRNLTLQNGYAPSVRDLCDALGYRSPSTVQMYLDRLEGEGYLSRAEGASRSIRLTDRLFNGTVRCLKKGAFPSGNLCEADFDGVLPFSYQGNLPEDARLIAVQCEGTWWVILQCECLPERLPLAVLQNGKLLCAVRGTEESDGAIGALLATVCCF